MPITEIHEVTIQCDRCGDAHHAKGKDALWTVLGWALGNGWLLVHDSSRRQPLVVCPNCQITQKQPQDNRIYGPMQEKNEPERPFSRWHVMGDDGLTDLDRGIEYEQIGVPLDNSERARGPGS